MSKVKHSKITSNKIITVLVILLVCSTLFAAGSITYSKYVQSNSQEPSNYTASEVYLDSNILSSGDNTYPQIMFNAKDTIRLYNYDQNNVNSISNYAYAPSCTLTYLEGTSTIGTAYENADGAFKFKANAQDEYAFTLSDVPTNATSVKVQCVITNGMNQIVTGELVFEQTGAMEYEIKDDGEGYINVYIYTNGSSSSSLTINYDSSKYVPDVTNVALSDVTSSSFTISDLEPYTGYKIIFLKTSDFTSDIEVSRSLVENTTVQIP